MPTLACCSFDENGDGNIGIAEFCTAMATIAAYAGNEDVDAAVGIATEVAAAEKAAEETGADKV